VSQVAVLGPGGVGGFVAAALARAGEDVTVVARPQTAAVLRERGLSVRSAVLGEFAARPAVVERLADEVEALVVATKDLGLQQALARVGARPRLVLPLLNGIEHLALLRARFGAGAVVASVIRVESDRVAPGVVVQTSPGCRIDIARHGGIETGAALRSLSGRLRAAGIEVREGGSEADVMWSKLARLCPLALTTSASDRPLGFVREDPRWRGRLAGAVDEVVAVARADGASLAAADTLAELEAAHAGLGSSMARDVAAGRTPELDAIAGAVLRAGERHGVACPTVSALAAEVAARAGLRWPTAAA
jgi:2-dehydropantoate 2-reductase